MEKMSTSSSQSFFSELSSKHYILLLLLIIGLLGGFVYVHNQKVQRNYQEEVLERDELKQQLLAIQNTDFVYGDETASVKLVMYADARCQYCRQLLPKLIGLASEYNGEVAMIHRPIAIYFARGTISNAERVSECIGQHDSGQYYPYLLNLFDRLEKGQELQTIGDTDLYASAKTAGISATDLVECVNNPDTEKIIKDHHSSGNILGVTTIPHTFITNGKITHELVGNRSSSLFRTFIDEVLNE